MSTIQEFRSTQNNCKGPFNDYIFSFGSIKFQTSDKTFYFIFPYGPMPKQCPAMHGDHFNFSVNTKMHIL